MEKLEFSVNHPGDSDILKHAEAKACRRYIQLIKKEDYLSLLLSRQYMYKMVQLTSFNNQNLPDWLCKTASDKNKQTKNTIMM